MFFDEIQAFARVTPEDVERHEQRCNSTSSHHIKRGTLTNKKLPGINVWNPSGTILKEIYI